MSPRHLVSVWNPSYESDAMDAHISVLLRLIQKKNSGNLHDDDIYVYWGKVRSSNRQAPMPHLDDILAIDSTIGEDETAEVHCYLTDYNSLYVAHVGGITDDELIGDPEAEMHIPDYYRKSRLSCDFWFQLWDIRRLVQNDPPAVIAELAKLRNTRYNDRPVSIYGGMVDLPLIVTRSDNTRWFDEPVRDRLIEGRHWVEFDAESTAAGELQKDLRDNRFGATLWAALDPATRRFIATGEYIYRTHRSDPTFNLGSTVVNLANGVEIEVNRICAAAMSSARPEIRMVNVDGYSHDIASARSFTLGQLARIISGDRERSDWLARHVVKQGRWFTEQLPPVLEMIADARNDAAHGGMIDRDTVTRIRNLTVGVGCEGLFLKIAEIVRT